MYDVPMELVNKMINEFAYESPSEEFSFQDQYEAANEEAHYYSVLNDLIDVVRRYGYARVLKDLGEMFARNR
jgi:hypothetical protein